MTADYATTPNNFETFFEVKGDLKLVLDYLDDTGIRTRFAQTSDPVHLAFKHIDSKPLAALAKEFMDDLKYDFVYFITNIFS